MNRPVAVLAALVLGAFPGVGTAQRAAPLLKTDLIELLSSPVIPGREVAELVRRNCLAFRPTERDLADIRSLGASPEVVASITGCVGGAGTGARQPEGVQRLAAPAAPLAASASALQVVVRQARIVAAAGGVQRVVVLAARGGIPQPGVQIALRGTAALERSGRDLSVATDDSGFAVFDVRVGRRLGIHRLEVAPAAGGTLPGRPVVELVVRAGPPTSAYVEPREVVFDQGLDSIVPIAVVVRDSIGHPVVGEVVVLGGNAEASGFRPDTAVTDSLGRARLFVSRGRAQVGGALQVKVRERQLAWVDAVIGVPLLESGTAFLPASTLRGAVHSGLGAPLVFEARSRLGRPAAGRTVTFRAVNASVTPATAVTDSAGHARVDVTLGGRVGPAVVVATVDSLEKQVTLQVEPGPPVELVLEHRGARVDGRWVIVGLDTTFVLVVRARDAYGNSTAAPSLARMLREIPFDSRIPIARLLGIQEDASAVALTFKAIRPGRVNLKLRTAEIGASVWLEVVAVR